MDPATPATITQQALILDSATPATVTPQSITLVAAEPGNYCQRGCLLNAAWTYYDSLRATTTSFPGNSTASGPSVVFESYAISTLVPTNGKCRTEFGSDVVLSTPYSLTIKAGVSGNALTRSVASVIQESLGFLGCFALAQIVTPSTTPTTKATTPAASGTRNSIVPSATSISVATTFTDGTPDPKARNQRTTVKITTSVIFSLLGFTTAVAGVVLFIRRRKKAHLAKAKAESADQESSDIEPSRTFQGKPELDAEQQRHELEAEKERCELEGQSSRYELTAPLADDEDFGNRTLQELRGVEPSHELDIEHGCSAEVDCRSGKPGDEENLERTNYLASHAGFANTRLRPLALASIKH